jgi:hypothetical protein
MPAFTARAVLYGVAGAAVTALVIGIPTVLIPNPLFQRMIPTRPTDYLIWAVTIGLVGLICASYAYPAACAVQEGKLSAGGVLSFLAVGCPVCNKIALLALGSTGAVTYFQPLQPLIGLVAVALLGYTLALRWRGIRGYGPPPKGRPVSPPMAGLASRR